MRLRKGQTTAQDRDFCRSCDDLRETDPSLIVNGFTDSECTSLKNDTGLIPENGHNDCQDIDDMNDCLIGNITGAIDPLDVCDWKEFTKHMLTNVWTMFKAVNCSMCGMWEYIHYLLARHYTLVKDGNRIKLVCTDGTESSVIDDDTKYALSKDGSTIKLTGTDGAVTTAHDDNTTYGLTKSGSTITLTDSDGRTNSVNDDNTTYSLTKSGSTIKLTGSDGSVNTVTDTDTNTTYTLTKSGDQITLNGSDGSHTSVTDSDTNTDTNTTYTLTKSGNQITLNGSDGSHTSVTDSDTNTDTDTWKPNTASQEGYVVAGQANRVWKTDKDGNPAWREYFTHIAWEVTISLGAGGHNSFPKNIHLDGWTPRGMVGYNIDQADATSLTHLLSVWCARINYSTEEAQFQVTNYNNSAGFNGKITFVVIYTPAEN